MAIDTQSNYLVITTSGEGKVGLVDQLSSKIAESGCNIEESRMAVLGAALIARVGGGQRRRWRRSMRTYPVSISHNG